MKSTVVLFPGALGDAVCFEPTARRLAADGPLTVYARGSAAELLPLFPVPPAVRSLDAPQVAQLFAPLDAPGTAPAWLAEFDRVLSFTGSGSREVRLRLAALRDATIAPFPSESSPDHACDAYLRAATGEATAVAPPPRLVAPPGELPRALQGATGPTLALHPGSGGRAKRARAEVFARVARRWRERGGRTLVLVGPAEAHEVEALRRDHGSVVAPSDVGAMAALLMRADAYVGNDAGPTHVAAALGLPGIAIFTASDPTRFAPRSARMRVVDLRSSQGDAAQQAEAVWSALAAVLP